MGSIEYTLDYDRVRAHRRVAAEHEYDVARVQLYGVGVGLGFDVHRHARHQRVPDPEPHTAAARTVLLEQQEGCARDPGGLGGHVQVRVVLERRWADVDGRWLRRRGVNPHLATGRDVGHDSAAGREEGVGKLELR